LTIFAAGAAFRIMHRENFHKPASCLFPALLVLTGFWTIVYTVCAVSAGPLDEYIAAPDNSFMWKESEPPTYKVETVFRLEITSQTWRNHVWQHKMLVVRPKDLRNPDIALLFITGDEDVMVHLQTLTVTAAQSGALAAVINRVPNQPLYDGRKEDALIAYTLDQYLKSGDKSWPLLFPMVKSAVRGMDTMEAFARKQFGNKLERFVVSGASKRGWTTWLTGAVDPRVKAIAPMVIDTLNMKAQNQWAEKMYGRQSEQINDYVELHLTERVDDQRTLELRSWIDPYSYRDRYRMPKLLLLGTNDRYWVVDSLRHYWNELPEPKLIFQTPNAGHDLAGGSQAIQTLAAFFQIVADKQELPRMEWTFQTNSSERALMEVSIHPAAKKFRLWTANSIDRDFRDDKWTSSELESKNNGTAVSAKVETPKTGYRAYMVEAEMTTAKGSNYRLSTEARVTPDGPPGKKRPVSPASGGAQER
jgi:PhoPQ-activated pathogenicity-related protein